jgi:hypothetical protein
MWRKCSQKGTDLVALLVSPLGHLGAPNPQVTPSFDFTKRSPDARVAGMAIAFEESRIAKE